MLPRPPAVVRCRGCGECYWLHEAEEVGWVPCHEGGWTYAQPGATEADFTRWAVAEFVEEPTEDDYYRAIQGGLAKTLEQERSLRTLAWRRRNDESLRKWSEPERTHEPATGWRGNMEALASILDESDEEQRLAKAELARELGEFDEARRLIDPPFSRKFRHHVAVIARLIEKRKTDVGFIRGDEGLTAEERRVLEERRGAQEAEKRAKAERRATIALRQQAARERGDLKDGDRCPRCGFSYAWDGTACYHCHLHEPS